MMDATNLSAAQLASFARYTVDLLNKEPNISVHQAGQRAAVQVAEEAGRSLPDLFPGQSINELVRGLEQSQARQTVDMAIRAGLGSRDDILAQLGTLFGVPSDNSLHLIAEQYMVARLSGRVPDPTSAAAAPETIQVDGRSLTVGDIYGPSDQVALPQGYAWSTEMFGLSADMKGARRKLQKVGDSSG